MPADYSNPLHTASLFVESVKFAPDEPRELARSDTNEMAAKMAAILAAANISGIDAEAVWEELAQPAGRYADTIGASVPLAQSILADAWMHGVALAADLHEPAPECPLSDPHADRDLPAQVIVFSSGAVIRGAGIDVHVHAADRLADVSALTAQQADDGVSFYAASYSRHLGVPVQWAADVFSDGLLRGWQTVRAHCA